MADYSYEKLKKEYQTSKTNMQHFRDHWKLLLDIAYARLSTEKGFKSRVREGSLSSLIYERAARVVAQPPTGVVRALSRNDTGKSLLMSLVWNKYVIPNANTDFSFTIKLRMWDYYSLIFGAMPFIYDWRIDDEYIGPDATLIHPNHCFPQVGRLSLNSCRRVYVETFHDPEYLKSKMKLEGWNAKVIAKILKDFDENSQPSSDGSEQTHLQNDRGEDNDLHKGQIKLVTCYERGAAGRWVTFAPDFDCEDNLRDIQNPHQSGRIPIVFKYAMPLIDSIWGMGDVERGESLQRAIDTAINLGLDFTKFKIFPPMWYTQGVNKSQLRYEPSAKWNLPGPWGTSAGFVSHNTNSTNESQMVYQFLKGALLNQNGTTDTTISADAKMPGYGKTPDALKQLEKRENARDQWDRNMFEEAYEELANGMINLIGARQAVPMDFHIFDEDITDLVKAGFTDLLDLYESAKSYRVVNGKLEEYINDHGTAKITLQPERLGGKYLFQIDANSSIASDEVEEFEKTKGIIELLATPAGQAMIEAAKAKGFEFHPEELLKQLLITSGIRNRDKIYTPIPEGDQDEEFDARSMIKDPSLLQQLEEIEASAAAPAQPGMQPNTGGAL